MNEMDSREELEAAIRTSTAITTDDVLRWLDRQAAITERELQDKLDQCMESYADAIDSRDYLRAQLDEYDETHMPLPLDADGVPIRLGDVVEFGENRNQGIVKALNEHMVIAIHVDDGCTNYAKYGLLWNADACRHVKPRTIEDVLKELACDVRKEWVENAPLAEHVYSEYADEIRELMGGDA